MEIKIIPGFYLVIETKNEHELIFLVDKNKLCSCAYTNCQHVRAVARYLRKGGARAPGPVANLTKKIWESRECVICGTLATAERGGVIWKCSQDSSHFWEWYGVIRGVKQWLCNPKAGNKIWSAYNMTREEFYNEV